MSHLDSAADRGRELEPVEEAARGLHAGAVEVVLVVVVVVVVIMVIVVVVPVEGGAVRIVPAQLRPGLAMRGPARAVTQTVDGAADQREGVRVHDGVDGPQGEEAHLHRPRLAAALRLELVAESLAQSELPGDGGEVREAAVLLLHHHLAVHHSPGGGAVSDLDRTGDLFVTGESLSPPQRTKTSV